MSQERFICVWTVSSLLWLVTGSANIDVEPHLSQLSVKRLRMNAPNGTLIEGGTLIRNAAGLHLFTTDKTQGVVNTSLVYYHSPNVDRAFVFVVRLICCSTGIADGQDPRASLWAPMPSFDAEEKIWHLFYVGYRSAPNNASGWFSNFDGRIYHAVSTTNGEAGIAGPFKDLGVVLEPGEMSQPWEGLQGTDSISPPFRLSDGTLAAFYGSAHTESSPPVPFRRPHSWWNGLVFATNLGAPFERRVPTSLVNFNNGASENPVVTYLDAHNLYIAVFDDLTSEAQGFGLSWSIDGLTWALAKNIPVDGGVRTPLSAMLEGDSTLTVYYTSYRPGIWSASFRFEVRSHGNFRDRIAFGILV